MVSTEAGDFAGDVFCEMSMCFFDASSSARQTLTGQLNRTNSKSVLCEANSSLRGGNKAIDGEQQVWPAWSGMVTLTRGERCRQ